MKKIALFIFAGCWGLMAVAQSAVARWDKLREYPTNVCKPKGWLLEFLRRQKTGLTGHPDVLSYPFNSCLWAGVITREGEGHGDNWWRYEQTAYYSDGLLRLGYLLADAALIRKGEDGIHYTLAHAGQDGRLGPGLFSSQWPIAVYFRALEAAWQASGDRRIVEALHRHYLSYGPAELGMARRNIVNVEGMLWTYGQTGDPRLLVLAEKAYAMGGFELNQGACLSSDKLVLHGVTYMEMAKLPAMLYIFTGKKIYLQAALNAFAKLERDHLLPDGVPSSNEFLAGKDPLQSHETCDITDYSWSLGYLLMATGDARWADQIEKAAFNAGPGAVSKDFKNLQYFSSVNQVIATGSSNHNTFAHGSTWMAYWPCHETECCAGNVHRLMPDYADRMWLQDSAGGVVAALYGPSEFAVPATGGRPAMRISEETAYPFSETIDFTFDPDEVTATSFSFRIPGWCRHAVAEINGKTYMGKLAPGSFVRLNRTFMKGDHIVLRLPMEAKLSRWGQWGGCVERGPLLYAYAVPEQVRVDTATYANLLGKRSPDPAFPALDIRPAGEWNYALALNAGAAIKVIRTGETGYPLDPGKAPVVLSVPVRTVKDWALVDGRYTPPLPERGKYVVEGDTARVMLVPYGSTRLRVSVFPLEEGGMGDGEGMGAAGTTVAAKKTVFDADGDWKFGSFGDHAGGKMSVEKNKMTLVTQQTPHAFFEADAYSFAYQKIPFPYDDCSMQTVSVKVTGVTIGSAGIMMRSSTRPEASNVHLETSPTGDVILFSRRDNGQATTYSRMGTLPFPMELKLVRQGNVFTAWYKDSVGQWMKSNSAMAAIGAQPVVGFYACSGQESQIGYSSEANTHMEVSFYDWDLHYQENFLPAEKNYTDTMALRAGTLLRDNFNDGDLSNEPAGVTNPVWSGITYGYLPHDKAGGRYWRKTGDGIFYLGDKKWADYQAGVDLSFDRESKAPSEFLLQLRYQNLAVYAKMARYYAAGVRDGNKLFFEKYEAGATSWSKVVPIPNYFTGGKHRLEVRLLDRSYEVYYDGRRLIAGIDTLKPITYGNIALKFNNVLANIDNLEVVRIEDPVNGEADNYLQDYYDTPLPAYLKQYGIKTEKHEK
jgi:hypothetical protein